MIPANIPANTILEYSLVAAVRPRWIWEVGEEGEWGGAAGVRRCVTKYQHCQACSEEQQELGRSRFRMRRRRMEEEQGKIWKAMNARTPRNP
jgi:hypothetical protein